MNKQIPNTVNGFVWHYFKVFKYPVMGILFFRVLTACLEILSPYAIKLLVGEIENYGGEIKDLWSSINIYFWIIVGVTLTEFSGIRIFRGLLAYYIPVFQGKIKLDLFTYIQNHSYKYFADNFAGSLANKFNDMASSIFTIISKYVDFISAFIMLMLLGVTLLEIKWWFSVWFLIWIFIHIAITIYAMPNWMQISKVASESRSKTMGKIADAITNNINIRLFSGKKHESERLQRQIDIEKHDNRKASLAPIRTANLQVILMFIFVDFGMLVMAIYAISQGIITVADFVFIFLTMSPITNIMFYLSNSIAEMLYGYGTAKQAIETISKPHSVTDKDDSKVLNLQDTSINMSNISFGYSHDKLIFKDFSLEISAGQKVGIVGHSGAGKSTLSQLLLRYYDVDGGNIYIGGQDIAIITQDSLRDVITVVPQDTSLFHRTIMENIKFSKQNATDEEVYEATIKANAHDFILTLKHGYRSIVGERGIKLSVGQRQRIAIARAILKDAPIVLMDEATSALDSETEKYIQDSMENLMQGKTAIVIAHRLSTLKAMDRLIVMENGKIIEDGNHKELIEKGGYYHKLWSMQQSGFIGGKSQKHNF